MSEVTLYQQRCLWRRRGTSRSGDDAPSRGLQGYFFFFTLVIGPRRSVSLKLTRGTATRSWILATLGGGFIGGRLHASCDEKCMRRVLEHSPHMRRVLEQAHALLLPGYLAHKKQRPPWTLQ